MVKTYFSPKLEVITKKSIAKYYIYTTLFSLLSILAYGQKTNENDSLNRILVGQPKIEFDKTVYDFGTIEQSANGIAIFKIKNTGNKPLVIINGWTSDPHVIEYPRDSIAPGESAIIKIRYPTERIGPFDKTASIHCNTTPSDFILRIKGRVIPIYSFVKFDTTEKDIGEIDFGEVATIKFEWQNTLPNKAKITIDRDYYHNQDDVLKCYATSNITNDNSKMHCDAKEDYGTIDIMIKNIHGNTGRFVKYIKVKTNSTYGDTVIKIHGTYKGVCKQDSIVIHDTSRNNLNDGYCVMYYKSGSLTNSKWFLGDGRYVHEEFYKNGGCYKFVLVRGYDSKPFEFLLDSTSHYINGDF